MSLVPASTTAKLAALPKLPTDARQLAPEGCITVRDSYGKPVRTSRNLRGIIDHACERLICRICVDRYASGEGKLTVIWSDGTHVTTDFADFSVMCRWVSARSWFQGAPLFREGNPAGTVTRENPAIVAL